MTMKRKKRRKWPSLVQRFQSLPVAKRSALLRFAEIVAESNTVQRVRDGFGGGI